MQEHFFYKRHLLVCKLV